MRREDVAGERPGATTKVAITGIVVLVVVIGLALLVRATPAPQPFDPRSSRADGATGLVALLRKQGASVELDRRVPAVDPDRRLLVLVDRLVDAQREAVAAYVRAGGILVLADPASTLFGGATAVEHVDEPGWQPADIVSPSSNLDRGACSIDALTRLRGLYVPHGVRFQVVSTALQCFADGGHAFVVRGALGGAAARSVVRLGDNNVFTNQLLGRADNSGLATALLAPQRGTHVTILLGDGPPAGVQDVGRGDQTLGDLVRPGVWMALVELAVAFMVFAVARGVRPGRVLDEPLPAPVAGSELVTAMGALARRARHHDRAGWMLRTELHRDLCHRYRLDPSTAVPIVAGHARDVDGVDAALVERALSGPATDDRSLLTLAADVDAVRATLDAAATAPPQGAPG